jgi:hypothetical protein
MKDICSAQKVDECHVCYDCHKRNFWNNRCTETGMKRDREWCKSKCQRDNECLYWRENGEVGE